MESVEEKVKHILISIDQSEEADKSSFRMEISNMNDFIVTVLLSLKVMAKKYGVPYEILVEGFKDVLTDEEVIETNINVLRDNDPDLLI